MPQPAAVTAEPTEVAAAPIEVVDAVDAYPSHHLPEPQLSLRRHPSETLVEFSRSAAQLLLRAAVTRGDNPGLGLRLRLRSIRRARAVREREDIRLSRRSGVRFLQRRKSRGLSRSERDTWLQRR